MKTVFNWIGPSKAEKRGKPEDKSNLWLDLQCQKYSGYVVLIKFHVRYGISLISLCCFQKGENLVKYNCKAGKGEAVRLFCGWSAWLFYHVSNMRLI